MFVYDFATNHIPGEPEGTGPYWRDVGTIDSYFIANMELQPEAAATIHSANTVGNAVLEMAANRYRGMLARITRGSGAGQERVIAIDRAPRAAAYKPT